MAPKRLRGEGSSSNPTKAYDKKKFISEEASERYHSIKANKSLILERGILPNKIDDFGVAKIIEERGW